MKFLLPDNGYLFAEHDFKPSMFELLRLPFPVCALEFTATPELYAAGSGLAYSAKRIALCFDPWKLPAEQIARLDKLCLTSFLADAPEKCLAIMAVYEANGMWNAAIGVVLIDLEGDRPMRHTAPEAAELSKLTERVSARLQVQKTAHGLPAIFRTFPGRTALLGIGAAQAVENLCIDTIDEVRTAYEFLAAINCSNVGTQEIAAPKMLNERRRKKGRTLFYSYKVLDIAPPQPAGPRGETGPHASPRTHLRRGHLRRLGERAGNKVLWINDTVVNRGASSADVVNTYLVKN